MSKDQPGGQNSAQIKEELDFQKEAEKLRKANKQGLNPTLETRANLKGQNVLTKDSFKKIEKKKKSLLAKNQILSDELLKKNEQQKSIESVLATQAPQNKKDYKLQGEKEAGNNPGGVYENKNKDTVLLKTALNDANDPELYKRFQELSPGFYDLMGKLHGDYKKLHTALENNKLRGKPLTAPQIKFANELLKGQLREEPVREALALHKLVLYDRAPDIVIVDNKDPKTDKERDGNQPQGKQDQPEKTDVGSVFLKGKLESLKRHGVNNNYKNPNGFAKVVAAQNLFGNTDYHGENVLIQTLQGESERAVSIDHGKALMNQYYDTKSMVASINHTFEFAGYDKRGYNLNIEEFSLHLKHMSHNLRDDDIEKHMNNKIHQFEKAGFDFKGFSSLSIEHFTDPRTKQLKSEAKTTVLNSADEVANHYIDMIKTQRDRMQEMSKELEVISKFTPPPNYNKTQEKYVEEFKNRGWMQALLTPEYENPVQYAARMGFNIEGKNPYQWAMENNYKLTQAYHQEIQTREPTYVKNPATKKWEYKEGQDVPIVNKKQKVVVSQDLLAPILNNVQNSISPAQEKAFLTEVQKEYGQHMNKIEGFANIAVKEQIKKFYTEGYSNPYEYAVARNLKIDGQDPMEYIVKNKLGRDEIIRKAVLPVEKETYTSIKAEQDNPLSKTESVQKFLSEMYTDPEKHNDSKLSSRQVLEYLNQKNPKLANQVLTKTLLDLETSIDKESPDKRNQIIDRMAEVATGKSKAFIEKNQELINFLEKAYKDRPDIKDKVEKGNPQLHNRISNQIKVKETYLKKQQGAQDANIDAKDPSNAQNKGSAMSANANKAQSQESELSPEEKLALKAEISSAIKKGATVGKIANMIQDKISPKDINADVNNKNTTIAANYISTEIQRKSAVLNKMSKVQITEQQKKIVDSIITPELIKALSKDYKASTKTRHATQEYNQERQNQKNKSIIR